MFKAVLFSLDGDFVTDFQNSQSILEVWAKINDMGSKWFFYPLCFVANEKDIIVSANDAYNIIFGQELGMTIQQMKEMILQEQDFFEAIINS